MTYGLSPLTLLVLGGLVLVLARRRRVAWIAGIALFAAGWLGCTPWVANALVGAVEARATEGGVACNGVQAIVLLSGGLARPPRDARDVAALSAASTQRVMALVQRDEATLPLLIAGGSPQGASEAALMHALLLALAPGRTNVALEQASRTTWENAEHVAAALPARRVALATSALHLPRARRAFEAAGFAVCPWPLDRQYLDAGGVTAWIPNSTSARKTEAAWHELAGDLVYRWRASRAAGS